MTQRFEIKYILQPHELPFLERWIHHSGLLYRAYDDRKVNSIYLDTIDYQAAQDNLIGIGRRVKHRIRWYEQGGKFSQPIFELKLKHARLGTKITTKFSDDLDGVEMLLKASHTKCSSIINNIPLLQEYSVGYQSNVPTLKVEYMRSYYETFNNIRLTIDRELKFGDLRKKDQHITLPTKTSSKVVVEFKFNVTQQHDASELMSTLPFYPTRNSKYLLGLSMFGHALYL